eukprot:COSAG03_NODE_1731_length_3593_cov_87.784488_8_plen_187_part_01
MVLFKWFTGKCARNHFFLSAGADPSIKRKDGGTALSLAQQYNKDRVVAVLRNPPAADPELVRLNRAAGDRFKPLREARRRAEEARRRADKAPRDAEHARQCGLEDQALPTGTRIRVEGLGEGAYERWGKARIGANDHFVRFPSGVRKLQLRKLGPQAWAVVADDEAERTAQKAEAEAKQAAAAAAGA